MNDKLRYTIILNKEHHEAMLAVTDRHTISQAEFIEALINNMDKEKMEPIFAKIRADKVAGRSGKKELLAKLRNLTPEQLAVIEAMTQGAK